MVVANMKRASEWSTFLKNESHNEVGAKVTEVQYNSATANAVYRRRGV